MDELRARLDVDAVAAAEIYAASLPAHLHGNVAPATGKTVAAGA